MGFQDYGTKYGLSMDAENRFYTDITPIDSLSSVDPLKPLSAKQGNRLFKMSETKVVTDAEFITYSKDGAVISAWEHRCICHGLLRIIEGLVRYNQASETNTWYTIGFVKDGFLPIVEERTFGTLIAVNWTNWGIANGTKSEHAEVVLTNGGELKINYGLFGEAGSIGVYYKLPYIADASM